MAFPYLTEINVVSAGLRPAKRAFPRPVQSECDIALRAAQLFAVES
jgi:hypothetical protein